MTGNDICKYTYMWLEAAIAALETQADEKTRLAMLESCGRACARHSSIYRNAKAVRGERKKIDGLLDKLSEENSGQVRWRRDAKYYISRVRDASVLGEDPSLCRHRVSATAPRAGLRRSSIQPLENL